MYNKLHINFIMLKIELWFVTFYSISVIKTFLKLKDVPSEFHILSKPIYKY